MKDARLFLPMARLPDAVSPGVREWMRIERVPAPPRAAPRPALPRLRAWWRERRAAGASTGPRDAARAGRQ